MRTEEEVKNKQFEIIEQYNSHNPLDRLTAEAKLNLIKWILNENICVYCGANVKK